MEAVPRLPMISFGIKTNTEVVSFGAKLKQYISSFYHEDAESYNNEIHQLETLRAAAVRPSIDVSGCQMLKKYYCQLHFLKSRFPMEENQACSVYFSWRDNYSNMVCSVPDIDFELMNVLYDIGAVHSKLGASDSRVTPEGMKMACTHFQCAAWAFQTVRETYPQMINLVLAPEIIHFMHLTCLAQAQECILEKSMMDNRKATIIAKVAVQVVDYYKQALSTLQTSGEEGPLSDLLGSRIYKDWIKYLNFKVAYHKAIALLYQGQQAEEQQKMGERVAFYQAASDQLQEACKRANNLSHQQEIAEALAFTGDVVEGKRKAAKNENEFIYHEDVPDKDALQEVKGASLVKGIVFNINDVEVSGTDIFARLVPMEAHEASSMYSEQKAQMLRQLGELVENKDRALAEFMSSMQLDVLTQMCQASGLTQDIVDRAAAMSARPTATQDLVSAMAKLSNTYHDVEAMLNEIDCLLKEEEKKEQEYQTQMGSRPPSIIATDLTREFTKYQEAHSKASDSNQNLHRAMTTHIANLKILALPLSQLKQQIPSVELPNREVDEEIIREMESLLVKVDEMKNQRALLWAQLRDAVQNDDITSLLVTRSPEKNLDQLFSQELQKHRRQAALIEQNMAAQENILKALIDAYARFTNTRRYLQDTITKRSTMLSALVNSYDTYDDLLAKANKGFEFYNKLETNVTKLLQRIKSTCKVQDEEREQMLAKHNKKKPPVVTVPPSTGPKLKDYLESKLKDYAEPIKTDHVPAVVPETSNTNVYSAGVPNMVTNLPDQVWPPAVRPAPVGSEMNSDTVHSYSSEQDHYIGYTLSSNAGQIYYNPSYATAVPTMPNTTTTYSNSYNYTYMHPYGEKNVEQDLSDRMAVLMSKSMSIENQEQVPNQTYGYPINNPTLQTVPSQNIYYQPHEGPLKQDNMGATYLNTYNSSTNSAAALQTSTYSTGSYPYQTGTYMYDTSASQASTNAAYNTSTPQSYTDPTNCSTASMQPGNSYTHSIQVPNSYAPANNNSYTVTVSTPSNTQMYSQIIQPTSTYEQTSLYTNQLTNPHEMYSTIYSNSSVVNQDNSAVYSSAYAGNCNMYQQQQQYQLQYEQQQQQLDQQQQLQQLQQQQQVQQQQQLQQQQQQLLQQQQQQYSGQTNTASTIDSFNQQIYGSTYSVDSTSNAYYAYNQPQSSYACYGGYINTSAVVTQAVANPVVSTNYSTGYSVNQTTVPTNTGAIPENQIKKENSNIDLLSGLDFSINQVPLVPQQNKTEPSAKEVGVTKTIEQSITNPIKPSSIKSEDKFCIPKEIISTEKKLPEKQLQRDFLQNPDIAKQFTQEVEKFEKFVDLLVTKTLNGPTTLDLKWKEIQDNQEMEQQRKSISIARCYPMKNRYPDILPYDQTRVKLCTTKDDYINASYLKDITPNSPVFIVTQSPLQSTYIDFWTMVWEQQIETIVCLLGDNEIEQDFYWPKTQDHPISLGNMTISLQQIYVQEHWTDRVIIIHQLEQRSSRTVRHLQFTAWPGSLFPSPAIVVNYINEILQDSKILMQPLLVHCLAGIGRSGLMCLIISAIIEVLVNPTSLPDLSSLVGKLSNGRKNILRDREHFKFAYHAFLHFLKEICLKGSQEKQPLEGSSVVQSHSSASSDFNDPLSMLDPLWATKKNT